MPGTVCKVIRDSGRARAAADYYGAMVTATEKMVSEAILRGVLAPDDPTVATINERLCYWAEKQEAWSAELLELSGKIAEASPMPKKTGG
jgi:hypothetical protein